MLNLTYLYLLLTRIESLELLLEPKGKAEQITVVRLELADDRVTFENSSRLVSLD